MSFYSQKEEEKTLALNLTVLTIALLFQHGFVGGSFELETSTLIILVSYPLQVVGAAMFSAAVYRAASIVFPGYQSRSYRHSTYFLSAVVFHISIAFTYITAIGSVFLNGVLSVVIVTLVMHGAGMVLFKNEEEKEEEEI